MMIHDGINKSVSKNWPLQLFLIQLDLMNLDPVRASKVVKDAQLMYLGKA